MTEKPYNLLEAAAISMGLLIGLWIFTVLLWAVFS